MSGPDSILRLESISKSFPGSQALTDVSLAVHAGEVLGLLGQNGAGKSTLVKILAGAERPSKGTIFVEGTAVAFRRPVDAQRAGIHTIFQEFSLVPQLSVAENIYLSDLPCIRRLVSWRKMRSQAAATLRSIGFGAIDVDARVTDLSTAEQQIVEIAKAVHHRSKVILLDEPTATLPRPDVEKLFRILRQLRGQGVSLLYISHHLDEIHEICDRVSILRNGRHVTTQPVAELDQDRIVALMLGKSDEDRVVAGHGAARSGEASAAKVPAFEIRNLSDQTILRNISLAVMPGESIAVTGLVGSGQLQLAACAFGAQDRTAGTVLVHGKPIRAGSPRSAVAAGIGWVPEERKSQGLILNMSVRDNLTVSSLHSVSRFALLDGGRETAAARRMTRALSIKTPTLDHAVKTLSGGNQQKIVFGKWLLAGSTVMILSDPTRGVDVGAREEIYREIRSFLDEGGAALVVTSDIDEAMLFDRILVIARGRLVGEFRHGQVDHDTFLSLLR